VTRNGYSGGNTAEVGYINQTFEDQNKDNPTFTNFYTSVVNGTAISVNIENSVNLIIGINNNYRVGIYTLRQIHPRNGLPIANRQNVWRKTNLSLSPVANRVNNWGRTQ
jgi:hypothetical protein